MITFKRGVEVTKIQPVTLHMICEVHSVLGELSQPELVVTSISDGEHMPQSKHYSGEAFDCRIWTIPESMRAVIFNACVERLGSDYDCIWHKRSHFHFEYDPKGVPDSE